jgi:hypothetical protein
MVLGMKSRQTIETIEGAGNSTHEINYEVNDSPSVSGTYYYRLTQTDYDGSRDTFEAKSIYFEKSITELELEVYPNPYYSGELHLRTNTIEEYKVMLYDISGQLKYSGDFNETTTCLTPTEQKKGIYLINVQASSGEVVTKKLVVQ